MKIIDLNADLGEGMPHEQEILPLISSANICCGAHAGSLEITRTTVISCLRLGIRIGAHPGYPDPEHFGRRSISELDLTPLDILSSLESQILSIPQAKYIKPHGAFYNDTANGRLKKGGFERSAPPLPLGEDLGGGIETKSTFHKSAAHSEQYLIQSIGALDILEQLLAHSDLPLMGLPQTSHQLIRKKFIREGFIDRRYDNNHRLLPRSNPDAVIHDPKEAIDQALRLAETCDSLCVHGDNPSAPELLTKVRSALESSGYTIAPK